MVASHRHDSTSSSSLRPADMVFLLGHHPDTRRPVVHEETLGIAVAAALIGELMLGRHLVTTVGPMLDFGVHYNGGDPALNGILAELIRVVGNTTGQSMTVGEAVDWFRAGACRAVAGRLESDQLLTRERTRTWLGRQRTDARPNENLPVTPLLSLNNAVAKTTPGGPSMDKKFQPRPEVCLVAGILPAVGMNRMLLLATDDLTRVASINQQRSVAMLLLATAEVYSRRVMRALG